MRMAIVVLGVSLLAAPAFANTQGAQQGEAPKAANAPAAKASKLCIKYGDVTGSRLQRVKCRTKSDWELLGVDIDALGKD